MEIGRWLGVSLTIRLFNSHSISHLPFQSKRNSRVPIFQSASIIWMNNSIFLAAEAAPEVTMQLTDWMIDSLSHGSETLVMWLWQVRIPGFTRYTFFADIPFLPTMHLFHLIHLSDLIYLFHLSHLICLIYFFTWFTSELKKVKRCWMKQ